MLVAPAAAGLPPWRLHQICRNCWSQSTAQLVQLLSRGDDSAVPATLLSTHTKPLSLHVQQADTWHQPTGAPSSWFASLRQPWTTSLHSSNPMKQQSRCMSALMRKYATSAASVAQAEALARTEALETKIPAPKGNGRHWNGNGSRSKETATQRALRTPTFQVVEFTNQRGVAHTPLKPRTAEQLGLAVRDMSLFASDHRLTQQRATIMVRDTALLFKTEAVKAIIRADKATLFRCKRDTDTVRVTESLLFSLEDPHTNGTLPFELCVLEVLLFETVQYFEKKTAILHRMLEYLTSDITAQQGPFPTADHAQQLVPIQKLLVAVRADVKETSAAITSLMEDQKTLQSICLTERAAKANPLACGMPRTACPKPPRELPHRPTDSEGQEDPWLDEPDEECRDEELRSAVNGWARVVHQTAGQRNGDTPHMRMATAILETYEGQVESLQSFLAEMEENLENARETWHMQLDSARNHIIYTTLWLSMLNISVMLATVMPSAFGMNLRSGFSEDSPYAFWAVSGLSICVAIFSYPLFNRWYMREWSGQAKQVTSTVKDLRSILLDHLDDIDDILVACKQLTNKEERLSRHMFNKAVEKALKGRRSMNREAADMLWRFFDTNKDGFIEQAELIKAVEHRHEPIEQPSMESGEELLKDVQPRSHRTNWIDQ